MNQIVQTIRAFAGRILGTLIGLLAGPLGALFGLLAGWMVDQYRANKTPTARVVRFLSDPRREKAEQLRITYGIAAVGVDLLTVANVPDTETVNYFVEERWPAGNRDLLKDPTVARRAVEVCFAERHRIERARIIPVLGEVLDTAGAVQLIDLLVRTLSVRGRGIVQSERRILESVCTTIGVQNETIARMEELHGSLPREDCEVLGVRRDADRSDIRRAYRVLVAQFHPDTGADLDGGQREIMESAFLRVRKAYESLIRQIDERDATASL